MILTVGEPYPLSAAFNSNVRPVSGFLTSSIIKA